MKTEVNRLQRSVIRRFSEWRNDQWSDTLEFLDPGDQSLWKMAKWVMRFSTLSPPGNSRGIALSVSLKAEALADNLELQFQLVTDLSVPAIFEKFDVALRSYFLNLLANPC